MCADILNKEERSKLMGKIKREDTKPELIVRKAFHKFGLRFRLHRKDLPGTPDLVFPKYKFCVFVNGCFWHRHLDCKHAYTPKSNIYFWLTKFRRNIERDNKNISALRTLGWDVVIIWECETMEKEKINKRINHICETYKSPNRKNKIQSVNF